MGHGAAIGRSSDSGPNPGTARVRPHCTIRKKAWVPEIETGKGLVAAEIGIHGPRTLVAFSSVPPVQVMVRPFGLRATPRVNLHSTVTVKEQVADCPARLVARLVTTVVPSGKRLPDGGVDTRGTLGS